MFPSCSLDYGIITLLRSLFFLTNLRNERVKVREWERRRGRGRPSCPCGVVKSFCVNSIWALCVIGHGCVRLPRTAGPRALRDRLCSQSGCADPGWSSWLLLHCHTAPWHSSQGLRVGLPFYWLVTQLCCARRCPGSASARGDDLASENGVTGRGSVCGWKNTETMRPLSTDARRTGGAVWLLLFTRLCLVSQVELCECVLKENKKRLMNERCGRSAECLHQALMSSGEVLFEAWYSLALPDTTLPSAHASPGEGEPCLAQRGWNAAVSAPASAPLTDFLINDETEL